MKSRGIKGILLATVDGLKGFPAITAVVPEPVVQTCIVHLLRNSMDCMFFKDRRAAATALRDIYRAVDAQAAEQPLDALKAGAWGQKFPAIGRSWRRVWSKVIPFFDFPRMFVGSSTPRIPSCAEPSGRVATFRAMMPPPSCSF